nr:MAG TPA: hypothetical protein [Caudoviricetes sp.]
MGGGCDKAGVELKTTERHFGYNRFFKLLFN